MTNLAKFYGLPKIHTITITDGKAEFISQDQYLKIIQKIHAREDFHRKHSWKDKDKRPEYVDN